MSGPFTSAPALLVRSRDGTPIAVFAASAPRPDAGTSRTPAVLLVHGTTSDHTTWRTAGPLLAARRAVLAMDRRGRGASGDGPAYGIEREYEDLAAVAEALAAAGGPVDVVGHSFGGRCALGASLRTPAIRRVVSYEGAPVPAGVTWADEPALATVAEAVRRGEHEAALETFFRVVVGMDDEAIARYRADPVWSLRVAAAPTLVREIEAEASPPASLEVLASVQVPVLQLLGTASPAPFQLGTAALAERLRDGRVVEIAGAAHAAHHTHAAELVGAIEAFLDG